MRICCFGISLIFVTVIIVGRMVGTHRAKLCSRPWRSHRCSSWFGCGLARCCATTGALVGSRNALFDDGYMLCIIQGGFWKNFTFFYMRGLTRFLRSSRSGRAFRRQRQWHVPHWVFLVLAHLALCSHDCRQSAEKCKVDASVAREMNLEICTVFYVLPVSFRHVQRSKFCASRFFGALKHSQV